MEEVDDWEDLIVDDGVNEPEKNKQTENKDDNKEEKIEKEIQTELNS